MKRKVHVFTKSDSQRQESLWLHPALKPWGPSPPNVKDCLKIRQFRFGGGGGNQKIQVKTNKEQAQKISKAVKPLLLKIMTEIYDCFLPRQKGAQLEG